MRITKQFFLGFMVSFIFFDISIFDKQSYEIYKKTFFQDISENWINEQADKNKQMKKKLVQDIQFLVDLEKQSELTYLEFFKKLD